MSGRKRDLADRTTKVNLLYEEVPALAQKSSIPDNVSGNDLTGSARRRRVTHQFSVPCFAPLQGQSTAKALECAARPLIVESLCRVLMILIGDLRLFK